MKIRALGVAAAALCVMMGAGPEDGPFKGQPGSAAKPAVKSQPAGGVQKAGVKAAENGPGQVVQVFLAYVQKGEMRRAIDECVDLEGFSRANLPGYSKLNVTDRTYVRQIVGVLFKSMLAGSPIEAAMGSELKGPLNITERGNEASVVLEFAQSPIRVPIELVKSSNGWRIVDVMTIGERLKKGTRDTKQADLPLFIEGVLAGALEFKHKPGALKSEEQEHADAMKGVLRVQIQSVQNQVELFKARTGHYPDLVKDGWAVLVKGGYLRDAPVNPVNNSSSICETGKATAQSGWEYDLATGTFGACFYDENARRVTMETP